MKKKQSPAIVAWNQWLNSRLPKGIELSSFASFEAGYRAATRQTNKYRRSLDCLCLAVSQFEDFLDAEYKKPASHERGRRVAKVLNQLCLINDRIRHFDLGQDLKTGKPRARPKV